MGSILVTIHCKILNCIDSNSYNALGNLGEDVPLAVLTNHGEKDPQKARAAFDFFKVCILELRMGRDTSG